MSFRLPFFRRASAFPHTRTRAFFPATAPSALCVLTLLIGLSMGLSACDGSRGNASDTGTPAAGAGLRWARTMDWTRAGDTVRLVVREPWKGARAPLRYVLRVSGEIRSVDTGNPETMRTAQSPPKKEREESGPVLLRLPARRIACLSAVHTGFLAALGETGRIVAVDAKRHVYDADVRAAVDAGRIVEVGAGSTVDAERLLAARPDLVLTNAVGSSENAALDRLRRAGIPVIVTAEWMERHPLARAEWLRLVGVLVGEEARADSVFAAVEASYLATARASEARTGKPSVLLGGPFRDQWFVSGGQSFMARQIDAAGGLYPWRADTTAGGVPLSFEAVLARARDADVWILPGDWRSLADGTRQDARFSGFSAFRRGAVYNNDARRRADGANDYWESGVARPDRELADLAAIFRGDEDSLFYYRRLPEDGE